MKEYSKETSGLFGSINSMMKENGDIFQGTFPRGFILGMPKEDFENTKYLIVQICSSFLEED